MLTITNVHSTHLLVCEGKSLAGVKQSFRWVGGSSPLVPGGEHFQSHHGSFSVTGHFQSQQGLDSLNPMIRSLPENLT